MCAVPKCMHACIHTCIHPYMHTLLYITLHYIHNIHTYIRTYHTIPYHTIHTIHTYHTYMHACMHTCIHAYSSHSRVYRHIYIYSRVYRHIYIYIYIIVLLYLHIYIYTYVCYFLLPISSSRVVRKKKQRISYSPQKGCNVTHFAMFDWRRVPHSTDSSSCFSLKKKHLQLTESVEFS